MTYLDFFFPQQSQAVHLREIAARSRRARRRRRSSIRDADAMDKRVKELEEDLGVVSLLLGSLMAQLEERGHVSRADLREIISEFDGADGEEDGRLDVAVLRDLVE